MRKDDEVSGGEANRIVYAFHCEPAVAGDDSKTAKAAIVLKLDRPLSACIDAAGHRTARFDQGENVGEWVGRDTGRSRQ